MEEFELYGYKFKYNSNETGIKYAVDYFKNPKTSEKEIKSKCDAAKRATDYFDIPDPRNYSNRINLKLEYYGGVFYLKKQ